MKVGIGPWIAPTLDQSNMDRPGVEYFLLTTKQMASVQELSGAWGLSGPHRESWTRFSVRLLSDLDRRKISRSICRNGLRGFTSSSPAWQTWITGAPLRFQGTLDEHCIHVLNACFCCCCYCCKGIHTLTGASCHPGWVCVCVSVLTTQPHQRYHVLTPRLRTSLQPLARIAGRVHMIPTIGAVQRRSVPATASFYPLHSRATTRWRIKVIASPLRVFWLAEHGACVQPDSQFQFSTATQLPLSCKVRATHQIRVVCGGGCGPSIHDSFSATTPARDFALPFLHASPGALPLGGLQELRCSCAPDIQLWSQFFPLLAPGTKDDPTYSLDDSCTSLQHWHIPQPVKQQQQGFHLDSIHLTGSQVHFSNVAVISISAPRQTVRQAPLTSTVAE